MIRAFRLLGGREPAEIDPGAAQEGCNQDRGNSEQGQAGEAEPAQGEPGEERPQGEPEVATDDEYRDRLATVRIVRHPAHRRERDRVEGGVHQAGEGGEKEEDRERVDNPDKADRDSPDQHCDGDRDAPAPSIGEPAEDGLDQGGGGIVGGEEEAGEQERDSALAHEERDHRGDHRHVDVDPKVAECEPVDQSPVSNHATRLLIRTHSTGTSTRSRVWWRIVRGRTRVAAMASVHSPRSPM